MRKIIVLIIALLALCNVWAQNSQYEYDQLQRITSVTYSDGVTISYTYDALGNRLSKTVTGVVQLPVVTTTNISQIGSDAATAGGNVTSDGDATVTARGVCWGTSHNPTVSGNHTTNGSGIGSFSSSLTNLSPNTTYYVRAYATNSVGTSYGEEKTFTTSCNTLNIQISGNSSVNFGQSVTLTASGASTYVWSTGLSGTSITIAPTISTTYSVTGTATNGCTGTASKLVTVIAQAPIVTTDNVSQIGSTTATTGGNVTSDGGATVTTRGVCWSTAHNPTVSGNHTTNGSGTGTYTSSLTNLSPNTTYYVRAYATNSVGTSYGEEKTFTTSCNTLNIQIYGNSSVNFGQSVTLSASGASTYAWSTGQSGASIIVTPSTTTNYSVTGTDAYGCAGTASKLVTVTAQTPVVITANVTGIGSTYATCSGYVAYEGGTGTISARGVCWSSSHNPTVLDSHTNNGTGTGIFTSSLTSLTPNTTYYVRAYATNSAGTTYGNEVVFTTNCQFNNYYDTAATCSNEPYIWRGLQLSTSGLYTDTIPNAYGCDDVYHLFLTVNQTATVTIYDTICQGDYYQQFGFDTLPEQYGVVYDQQLLQTENGCDSIVNLVLTVNRTYQIVTNAETCDNTPYEWRGHEYDEAGVYFDTLVSSTGCDSVLGLNLLVNPTYDIFVEDSAVRTHEYCNYGLTFIPNIVGDFTCDIQNYTVNGCDSIVHLTLHVINNDGVAEYSDDARFNLYPNPTSDVLNVSGENMRKVYVLYWPRIKPSKKKV